MENVIQVQDLKKTYTTHRRKAGFINAVKSLFKREIVLKHALQGVNFDIKQGEIVGFIGPNGAENLLRLRHCQVFYILVRVMLKR
jgi:ABC-2 type transport system ATP-binding protein